MAEPIKFIYEAKDTAGNVQQGILSAEDRSAADRALRDQGMTVVSLQEAGGRKDVLQGNVSAEDFVAFNTHLASVTESGLPLPDALASITEDMQAGHFKAAVEEVTRDIQSGKSLGDSLRGRRDTFSDLYISLVEAGEKSGQMSGLLSIVARQARGLLDLQHKIAESLLYPTVICVLLLAVYAMASVVVLPSFAEMIVDIGRETGVQTPSGVVYVPPVPTRLVLFLGAPQVALPVALAGVLVLLYFWFVAPNTRTGRRILQFLLSCLPVVRNMLLDYELSRIAGTLRMLLYATVPLEEAIRAIRAFVRNSSLARALQITEQALAEGANFSSALETTGAFPASFTWRISMGETSGKMQDSLEGLSELHLKRAEHLATRLSSVIEPMLICLTGILVGAAVFSLFLPFIRLTEMLGG